MASGFASGFFSAGFAGVAGTAAFGAGVAAAGVTGFAGAGVGAGAGAGVGLAAGAAGWVGAGDGLGLAASAGFLSSAAGEVRVLRMVRMSPDRRLSFMCSLSGGFVNAHPYAVVACKLSRRGKV